jgi:putative heme-binding domain-containing protein
LNREGYIKRVGKDDKPLPAFDEKTVTEQDAIPDTRLLELPVEQAARSYLHVNCAHCHRFGGGGGQVVLELDYSKPLKEMEILDARPRQGDFGIPDARIVKPGDPTHSVLLYRMSKFGRGHMPHLGSEIPDEFGLRVIEQWISGLGKGDSAQSPRMDALDAALRSPDTALPFAWQINRRHDDAPGRDKLLAAVAKLEPGPVRDLFEGYLPPDPKGRKLGSTPRPATILNLKGDATRGETIFFDKNMKCANCHKVGDRGTALGPELTAIGKTRSQADLLESLLQPSLRIEPQFAAYNVRTKDEKTYLGLVVKRDDKQLILRDAENKEIKLAAEDVDSVTPSRLSLMPEGQMAGLTPQEAADLLEFLVQRK